MSLDLQVGLALAQQLGLVGRLVGLQVLSVLSDVGPGPHVAEASDVDLQDAVEGVPPPEDTNAPRQIQMFCLKTAVSHLKHFHLITGAHVSAKESDEGRHVSHGNISSIRLSHFIIYNHLFMIFIL